MQTMNLLRLGAHALQSIIAIVVIGCSAAMLSSSTSSECGLAIFTGIATMLVGVFIATGSFCAKFAYKFWVMVAANVFTTIFWIATVAMLAHGHLRHNGGCGGYKHDYCYRKRYVKHESSLWAADLALSVIDGLVSIGLLGISFCVKRSHEDC